MKDLNFAVSIETTSTHLGVSLYEFSIEKKTFKKRLTLFKPSFRQQADLLFPWLTALLKKSGVDKNEISLLAVDVGPGSFTGVRVGVSAARALAQGLNIPLVGVNSLEALAYEDVKKNHFENGIHVAMLPALADEVYGAVYEIKSKFNGRLIGGHLKPLLAPLWCSLQDFKKKIMKRNWTVPINSLRSPNPETLAEVALIKFLYTVKKVDFHYSRVSPFYLQPSWAERALKEKKRYR